MLELSERKILNIKKYVHISPNIQVQQNRIMIYNWLIMVSQNTNKLQSNVWFCCVLVVILFFSTAKNPKQSAQSGQGLRCSPYVFYTVPGTLEKS